VTLQGENYDEWREMLRERKVFCVLCTVGKTHNPPAAYRSVLELWQMLFDLNLLDEGGQVLEIYGKHMSLYSRQLIISGDTCQLSAWSLLQKEHITLMRAAMTTIPPTLLREQRRQVAGLSAWNSFLSYSGQVVDAPGVATPTSLPMLFVVWDSSTEDNLPDNPEELPARDAAKLTCAIWRAAGLTSSGNKAKILTTYAKQRHLITNLLGDQHACSTVDKYQGSECDVVIGDLGRKGGHGVS
jgi:superfamily I DNA and/or RNA helicase